MMDTSFFFRVWGIYQTHWGREEQQQLKKRYSARLLETLLRNSHRMKGIYYMREVLQMLWEHPNHEDDHLSLKENREELLYAIKTMGKACMGEEDLYDSLMDPYTRMMNNIHVHRQFCYLSVEERQWMSLRRPQCPYNNDTKDFIYGLSAILVLPLCSI